MSSLGKTWKRGAREGNYTPVQWNIACRVKNGLGVSGEAARTSPSDCPTVVQAYISLGFLERGFCGVKYKPSVCNGVSGKT